MCAFIPSFLNIKANQIESWADSQIEARTHLPVLLRKLVHSTGLDLRKVDFPGYDNAQRKGSDGFVESGNSTPWIPKGTSYWEFGTNKKPGDKANKDYAARLVSVEANERKNSTFIFVTPRNWPGKDSWEKRKNKAGEWKSVRAFDASDLEQWLEQSTPGQIWLAEQINLPSHGYETLERVWHRWANASEPHLTPEIFTPSIKAYLDKFKSWIQRPSESPFVISADSQGEALAFLACIFDDEDLHQFQDLVAIFTSPTVLRTILASSAPLIPVVCCADTERELVDAYRRLHCIVFRPRNTVDVKADITLDLLGYEDFKNALTSMGIDEDQVDRLIRESGYSPTILRRRLSPNMAIRTPVWSNDDKLSKAIVPITLVGTWHTEQEADRRTISNVANREYEEIENDIVRLLRLDDSPVWSTGSYRGVASKIDALFAIAELVTLTDLARLFEAAKEVFSEPDPALALPEKDRWAAVLYGKKRLYSSALRDALCETLVLLAVYGNHLFQSRLGIDVEGRVTALIRELLTPTTLEMLISNNHELPNFAEAAPNEILTIIEEDLRKNDPIIFDLLKPADINASWVSPPRTGLLWALECLAWKPENLARVVTILARLSGHKIDDNWANKPMESLQAIFRSWMPQTAASVDQRSNALEMLIKRFPDIGWEICIEQIKPGSKFGTSSYRPRWRSDASGAGQVVPLQERYDFNSKVLDIIIAWPSHNEKTLGNLVESISIMPEEDQMKVWDLIDKWAQVASEEAKAMLREHIRLCAFTRRGRRHGQKAITGDRAHRAYNNLQSHDPLIRYRWLFTNQWVEESVDEIEDEDFDYQKREKRIDNLRSEAMSEIWGKHGFSGIKDLLASSDAEDIIGRYIARCAQGAIKQIDFIRNCLSVGGDLQQKAEYCLRGFLGAIKDETRSKILTVATKGLPKESCTRLIICAPFQRSTWRLLDDYSEDIRREYWQKVFPYGRLYTPDELTELIDRLLEAQRPRAAFLAVHMDLEDVETSRLKRLLYDIATVDNESEGRYRLDRYYISSALNVLDGRAGVTSEEMAQLELLFAQILNGTEHGIPNLENHIAQSADLFVQLVIRAYKRSDEKEDPLEWRIEDPEQRSAVASNSYDILSQLNKIPGTNKSGEIEVAVLSEWIAEVRHLCCEYARSSSGDYCIGQLLAKAPEGVNGIWPCEAVCEVMEKIASTRIGEGFRISVYNSRGVHFREPGGNQERELSRKYRAWAEKLHFKYPFVGSVIEDIAKTYELQALREDSEEKISKRLPRH